MQTHFNFDRTFELLSGNAPFPWQRRLFQRFVTGNWPESCNLTTGLGKTSVITIWLLALAHARIAGAHPLGIPRRLVYVVNRRTVVDQSTSEAQKLLEKLEPEEGPVDASLIPIRDALQSIAGGNEGDACLAISTLRGQFADNGEWRTNPARAAIIVGTVDMIGSRLLFSGYGCGFKTRPLHAGFLGHDALLIHDEAHLEPAFQELVKAIETEQADELRTGLSAGVPPLRVIELTATSRGKDAKTSFGLNEDDHADEVVRERYFAKKAIQFHEIDDDKKLAEKAAELALAHGNSKQAILVFLRRVEDVSAVADRLEKVHKTKVETLTGTMRGLERDRLATKNRPGLKDSVFARFLPDRPEGMIPADGTVFLVCTSAGEVGVNISADHLVCDLSPFESMAQRFGRVNRFGKVDGFARIDVLHPAEIDSKDLLAEPRRKTLELLRALPPVADPTDSGAKDASPHALSELPENARVEAFTPKPEILHVDGILFDAWSMTTIRPPQTLPGRPPVADWLHGVTERDLPETHVAWRREVDWISPKPDDVDLIPERKKLASQILEDYPLKPHELLRDRSDRVFKRLEKLAGQQPHCLIWLVSGEGEVEFFTLADVANPDKKERLNWKTLILPERAGGLNRQGMLSEGEPTVCLDVADEWYMPPHQSGNSDDDGPDDLESRRRRKRIRKGEHVPRGMRRVMAFVQQMPDEEAGTSAHNDDQVTSELIRLWYVRPLSADDEGSWSSLREEESLADHNRKVGETAKRFCQALGLDSDMSAVMTLAGHCHDLGKNRELWQTGIGNREFRNGKILAKSGRENARPPINDHYRHEFGSLLDLESQADFLGIPADDREFCRHLIAAHHGRGRPHFPPDEAFDPNASLESGQAAAAEAIQRFARLQRIYGRWGLAWLESLLRAADYLASNVAGKQGGST